MSEDAVTFRLADPEHRLAGVRLVQDVRIPGDQLGFHRSGDGWKLVIDRPPVNRMEYLLELRHAGGGTGPCWIRGTRGGSRGRSDRRACWSSPVTNRLRGSLRAPIEVSRAPSTPGP